MYCVFFLVVSKYGQNGLRRISQKTEIPHCSVTNSTVVFWPARDECSSRHDRLLLGEQIAKDIFHPLPKLEVLVRIQDQGLHECLGLLTTRFPNGFDGQAPFRR